MSKQPDVSMLWEAIDPSKALRDRFGFNGVGEAAHWVEAAIAATYGLDSVSCERIVMSGANALAWIVAPKGTYVLKWCVNPDAFDRLASLATVTAWLAGRGFSVAEPVMSQDGRRQVMYDGVSLHLQPFLAGEHLNVTEPDAVYEAGATLARLHLLLGEYDDPSVLPGMPAERSSLRERVTEWIEQYSDAAPADLRDELRARLAAAPAEDFERQLIHNDFRSANILCQGGSSMAVLDFEEARFASPIIDVARASVLLGTQFHNWAPIQPSTRRCFLDGYRSQRELNPAEEEWLPIVVLWYALAMIPAGDDPAGWTDAAHGVAQGI